MKFSRKIKFKSNLIASILIIVGIIVVINIVGYKFFHRFDLTQNREFSISQTTKSVLKNLDDIVNIKVYFSEKLPPQYISTAQEVKDILEEYQNYSDGKLRVIYIDPKDDVEIQAETRRLGIPQLQFNILEKDQFQITQGYLGLAVIYGDKKETLPVIENIKNLEYQLTAAIKKVTSDKISKIGFTNGHDEPSVEEERPGQKNMLKEMLRQQFNVTSVDTTRGEAIADDIDTLVINGPKTDFTDRELYIIDQFLMKGKSTLFLLDGVNVSDGLMATTNETGLEKLLANYGVDFRKNLVLDVLNEMLSFNDGRSMFFVQYPFWVKTARENFDSENVIVNSLETLLFPWVSSLSVNKDKIGDNKYSELIKTTDRAWTQSKNFNLNPTRKFNPTDTSQYTIAAMISGKFNSYFTGMAVPPKNEENSDEISSEPIIESTDSGRIIVVGDSDFITEGALQRSKGNMVFFQNMIDVLTQDENLIAIRAKAASDRPIKKVDDSQKGWIKFINIFGVSILVVIIGIMRFALRRRDSKREF